MLVRLVFVCVLSVFLIGKGASLTCYCSEGDCVNNQNTCEGIYCYLQVFFGNSPNEYHTDYGCLSRLQRTHCNQSSSEHHIKCCSREKECNRNLTIPIIAATSTVQSSSMPPISTSQLLPVPSSSSLSTLLSKPSPSTSALSLLFSSTPSSKSQPPSISGSSTSLLSSSNTNIAINIVVILSTITSIVLTFVIFGIVLIIGCAAYTIKRNAHSRDKHASKTYNKNESNGVVPPMSFGFMQVIDPTPVTVSDITLSCTSASGRGMPHLVERTIARGTTLGEIIGGGRFGQVYLGYFQGEKYAVKKFYSRDEQSWFREKEIYNSFNMRHENILTYVAADILSNNEVTELWLITQFHPKGSLFDDLHRDSFSVEKTLKVIYSACRGISYLHLELPGTQGKPSIAHRDIKSKNMLVRNDDTVCIADFGLAIVANSNNPTLSTPENLKQGTKRYMAPELLEEKVNPKYFESFKRTDMYSFGLVLWEVCRRSESGGIAENYQLPFELNVPHDPTFDDMRNAVAIKGLTPGIPKRWTNNELLRGLSKIMKECWNKDPLARPTSFYVRKKVERLTENCNLKFVLSA